MKRTRQFACLLLLLITAASMAATLVAPWDYQSQERESPNAPPSAAHLLGTDALGRDRFSRLLYGTRVSLLLAPAAALVATAAAALIGGVAGFVGGLWRRATMLLIDLFLSLPWLFLLLTVRAMLPLNVSPMTSVVATFLILGLLGWAASARVLCAGTSALVRSEFVLQAKAAGISGPRLFVRHVLPNLAPTLLAQFWISIPVFILAEANLGILGLGVAEPLPSWGSLLRELQDFASSASLSSEPWKLASLLLLVAVVTSFQLLLSRHEVTA